MGKDRTVIELLRGLGKQEGVFFTAVVKSVEGNTCTVNIGDFPVSDVRLKPTTTDDESTVLLTPAIGSPVLVGSFSGNLSNLFVLQADAVSEIYCKIEDISLKMDKEGLVFNGGKNEGIAKIKELEKNLNGLKTLVGDLATNIYTWGIALDSLAGGVVTTSQTAWKTSFESFKIGEMEDKKVKH